MCGIHADRPTHTIHAITHMRMRAHTRIHTQTYAHTHACMYVRIHARTIKAVGPFYMVYMPGEIKYPTSLHWKCVTYRGIHILA